MVEARALVRGTWGAAPVPGLEPRPREHIVEKIRMSGWEGTSLETILTAEARNVVIVAGAWSTMSIEHTARRGPTRAT